MSKKVDETQYCHFYDANDFVEAINKFMESEAYKKIAGERGTEHEKGFRQGLCIAPSVLMVNSHGCLRIPVEQVRKPR